MPPVSKPGAFLYVVQLVSDHQLPVRTFYLEAGEYLIGASEDADIHLPVEGVSRRHAQLRVAADGGVVITDLGSRNGTLVNARRVSELATGGCAEVAFGLVRFSISPVGGAGSLVAIGAGEGARQQRHPAAVAADSEQTSSLALHLEMARRVCRALRDRDRTAMASEAAASNLLKEWLPLLPASRLELVRVDRGGGEAVAAAASQPDEDQERQAENEEMVELELAAGWKLCSWTDSPQLYRQLDPLLEAMLRGVLGAPPTEPVAAVLAEPGPPRVRDLPPPGSLCPAVIELYREAGKIAAGAIPVLITGESGVGKEVLVRWLHDHSPRAEGPFVAINCSALARDLLETELFGIESGVATGVDARAGLFEGADGGTLFLDEIGDMAIETQAKILRVLQDQVVYRIGGRQRRQIDVRFLAATNQDLPQSVAAGRFRHDLYQRLAAFVVSMPPLRQRREDVPLLATHFFHQQLAALQRHSPGFTRRALAALVNYPWPGNVRELANEIARAVLLLEPGEPVDLPRLSPALREDDGGQEVRDLPLTLREAVARAEREAFAVAWSATGGDPQRTRDLLGIPRTTYYRKLKELGLSDPSSARS